jgi:hypothetical protein
MRLHASMQAICQFFLLKKKKETRTSMSHRHANESTQTRSHIVDPADRRRVIFENVGHSRKSVTIPSKNDVHHRSDGSARDAVPAVRRKIVGEPYIVASMHSMMAVQCSKCMCENYRKGAIPEV